MSDFFEQPDQPPQPQLGGIGEPKQEPFDDDKEIELWTSTIEVGSERIGWMQNRDDGSIEAYDAADVLIGVFTDKDAAGDAIFDAADDAVFDRLDAKLWTNGGSHANGGNGGTAPGKASEEPQSPSQRMRANGGNSPTTAGEESPSPPQVDRAQLETFIRVLFKHVTTCNWVSLRTYHDDREAPAVRITRVKLNGNFDVLIDAAFRDAELAARYPEKVVFCPPIATFTNEKTAKERDLAEGPALSTECDANAEAARRKLEALLGPATVVVESGGKWINPETGETEPKLHIHFRLKRPAGSKDDQQKLKLARKLATRLVGGDPTNVSIVHPIRWPGSVHRKGDPKLCRIISLNPDAEIDLDTALEILQKAAGNGEDPTARVKGKGERLLFNGQTVAPAFAHLKVKSLGAGISIEAPIERIRAAFAVIPNDDSQWNDLNRHERWHYWNTRAMALFRATGGSDEGLAVLHEWSKKSKEYDAQNTDDRWERIRGCPPDDIGAGSIFHWADKASPDWEQAVDDDSGGGDDGVTLVPSVQVKFRDLDYRKKPKASLANAVIAIRALGITVRQDLFRNRISVEYNGEAKTIREGLLTDDTISAVRSLVNNTYRIDCGDSITFTAIREVARDNAFDPILDMLDDFQAKWDGKKRLDTWVIDYMGCEDTLLNRAIGRLTLIAACRRARVPGCKYDNITNLEGPEGLNKSTLIRTLAGDDYFSDESIIGASSKEVQEQLDGKWMHENADLAGIVKRDVDKVNAFASRQADRARPAYGRVNEDRPRRSIEWGTINQDVYLLRQTGNRRWWPLKTTKIDIEAVTRDRAQLLGEAATYEAAGASIVLEEKLWGAATKAQEQRRITDPWEDILADMPSSVIRKSDDGFERVASADVLSNVLRILAERQTSGHGQRLSLVMKHLGWERNESGLVTINGHVQRGYIRRSPPPRTKAELEAIKAEAEASTDAKMRSQFKAMETDVQAEAWTAARVEQLLNATETHAEIKARKANPTD